MPIRHEGSLLKTLGGLCRNFTIAETFPEFGKARNGNESAAWQKIDEPILGDGCKQIVIMEILALVLLLLT